MSVNKKKILGIDYGDFSIGLAIFSCEMDFIYPYKTIFRKKANILRKSIREIIDIINIEGITDIVIGLPLNFDGTSGERVEKVKIFARMLESKLVNENNKSNAVVSIDFQDERLSTVEARERLDDRNVKRCEQKKIIDQIAAEVILEDYERRVNNGK